MSDLEKPIMSAIPTADEMWKAFEEGRARRGVFLDGIQTIHALVASRVVVQEGPTKPLLCDFCSDEGFVGMPCVKCGKRKSPPPLDPIKAIVDILELLALDYTPRYFIGSKLSALKRSLEPGSGE